jgi:hypothetical protein
MSRSAGGTCSKPQVGDCAASRGRVSNREGFRMPARRERSCAMLKINPRSPRNPLGETRTFRGKSGVKDGCRLRLTQLYSLFVLDTPDQAAGAADGLHDQWWCLWYSID